MWLNFKDAIEFTLHPINFVTLDQEFILSQLHLEEALLRADKRNWCIVNRGSKPAIVMGISAKIPLLINEEYLKENPIPLIRRFSGGGTVVIDENTIFITFIMNALDAKTPLQPEAIMHWSEPIYKKVFGSTHFSLKQNDYVIGEKKCGGNAQYLCKDRFLHHTSFLWDFSPKNMDYLKYPPKTPEYRQNRSHLDFLCTLKELLPSQEAFLQNFRQTLFNHYNVTEVTKQSLMEITEIPHRRSSQEISLS